MPDLSFDILVGFHVCPRPKLDGESEFCNCVKKKSSVPKLFPLWLTANSQKSCFLLIWSRSRALMLARGSARCGACCRASGRVVRSGARSVDRRENRFASRPFRARPVKTRRSPPHRRCRLAPLARRRMCGSAEDKRERDGLLGLLGLLWVEGGEPGGSHCCRLPTDGKVCCEPSMQRK